VDLWIGWSLRIRTQRCGGSSTGLIVGVAEAKTPVCKIRAHDECVGWVCKVGCKDLAKRPLSGGGCVADHDWNQWWEVVAVGPSMRLLDDDDT
jgi:hypothetical protein